MRLVSKRLIATALTLLILSGTLLSTPYQVHAGTSIVVTTMTDEFVQNGNCSLREAIVAANENIPEDRCPAGSPTSMDTIYVPTGTYYLTQTGRLEDISRTGDLDILQSVTIYGDGVGKTKIDALTLDDRVFQVINAGDVYFTSLEIKDGTAWGGQMNGRGGGIFNTGSVVHVYNVLFDSNKSTNTGGSIDNDDGSIMYVNRSTIQGSSSGHGGAIYNLDWMWVSDSMLIGNMVVANPDSEGTASGGAIDNNTPGATMVLSNSTLAQNNATATGGREGGAAIFNDGNMRIHNVTMVKNNGIGLVLSDSSTGYMRNTIIAGSTITNCDPTYLKTSLVDEGYNLVDSADCKFLGNAPGDKIVNGWAAAKIADLPANNGGPTQTYALLPGSPAIDGGEPGVSLAADQRIYARPMDGDRDPSGTKIGDIGAFEYSASPVRYFVPFLRK